MNTNEDTREIVEELIKINKLMGKTLLDLKWATDLTQDEAVEFIEEEQPVVRVRPKRKREFIQEAPPEQAPQMPPQPKPVVLPDQVVTSTQEKRPNIMEKLLGKEADQKAKQRADRMAQLEKELAELQAK